MRTFLALALGNGSIRWPLTSRAVVAHLSKIAFPQPFPKELYDTPHLLEPCLFRKSCALHTTSLSRLATAVIAQATPNTTTHPIKLYQR